MYSSRRSMEAANILNWQWNLRFLGTYPGPDSALPYPQTTQASMCTYNPFSYLDRYQQALSRRQRDIQAQHHPKHLGNPNYPIHPS